jgi:heme-degrading monooxygenase HmoA
MYVVIFRAKIRRLDDEYFAVEKRMRELAIDQFGCAEFHSVTEGENEVTLSWWPDEESIRAWKSDPEHLLAQREGRERWYESYSVEVALVQRKY